jgi:hypothetical protein
VTPASVAFANQQIGATSAPRTFTTTNAGTAPLAIASTALAGASAAAFAITADSCGGHTIAPGQTCATNVVFRPANGGSRTAGLVYADNAPGAPHSVALGGRGCLLLLGPLCL